MSSHSTTVRSFGSVTLASAALLLLVGAACSSSSASGTSDGGGGSSGGGSGGVASCSSPGKATPGPADDHCASAGADGGALVNSVTLACNTTAVGDDGGGGGCPYGATEFGQESDDDDCKYRVTWTSTPICQQPGSVTMTLVVTYKDGGKPVTGAGPSSEVFTTSPGDQDAATYCDDQSTHLGPGSGAKLTEGPPGTYVGPVAFDQAGQWTVRFHFFESCTDAPTAPHGHVAFHITVP